MPEGQSGINLEQSNQIDGGGSATQRILVDLAVSQNANAMNVVRSRFTDPDFCPASVVTELAAEGMSNFIEGQKLLLNLAQREYEIVTTGVKERVSGFTPAVADRGLQRGCAAIQRQQTRMHVQGDAAARKP